MSLYHKLMGTVRPLKRTTDGREIIVRCPYCGDSKKSRSHVHLYIKDVEDEAHVYQCRRCYVSGIFDLDTMHDMNMYDGELGIYLTESKNNAMRKHGGSSNWRKKKRKRLVFPNWNENNDIAMTNLQYINNRLNTNIEIHEAAKYKLILDPRSFIVTNSIHLNFRNAITNKKNHIKTLFTWASDNAVGFLSQDESTMIFRRVGDELLYNDSKRYTNQLVYDGDPLNIYKKNYIIGGNVDILSKDPIKIHLAEGVFDIMKVYNISNTENGIFGSVNGKDYLSNILSIVRMGFLDIDIHIYSDGEVPVSEYEHIRKHFPLEIPITIHYNMIDDDFGVTDVEMNAIKI